MPGNAESLPRTAVIIPAYRAARTVGDVVRRTIAATSPPGATIYVVDDGSDDPTGDESRAAGAQVLRHPRNLGKGAALATGIARALAEGEGGGGGRGAAWIVTLDADGQHPPELIPGLLDPLQRGQADLVLGARNRTGSMPWPRRMTNWLSATLASRVAGGGGVVPDAQTGFRAFSAAVARGVRPRETRYDYETAFLLGVLAAGYRVAAVPIPTIYAGAPSHFRSWADTARLALVFARYGRRILFGTI